MRFRHYVFFAVLVATPTWAASVDEAVADINALTDQIAALDDTPALAVAIVDHGEVRLQRTLGRTRNDAGGQPIDGDTLFRAASVSKGFASTLAALLIDEGRFALSDPVLAHVPQFQLKDPRHTQALTVEYLLSQRTGLPSNAFDHLLEAGASRGELLRKLAEVTPVCPVGRCYWYQNLTYSLISDVIEQSTGTYFEHQVAARLFQPLGMRRASFGMEALTEARNAAQPHVWRDGQWQPTYVKPTYYQLPAAAGINLSLNDLVAWLKAQMGGNPEVIPTNVLALVHAPRVYTQPEFWSPRWRKERLTDAQYGLGFRIYRYGRETLIFHGGAVEGFRAFMLFSPERQLGIVALWNSNSPRAWTLIPTLMDRLQQRETVDWVQLDRPIPSLAVRLADERRLRRAQASGSPK
jgi:beta-lactamase class C